MGQGIGVASMVSVGLIAVAVICFFILLKLLVGVAVGMETVRAGTSVKVECRVRVGNTTIGVTFAVSLHAPSNKLTSAKKSKNRFIILLNDCLLLSAFCKKLRLFESFPFKIGQIVKSEHISWHDLHVATRYGDLSIPFERLHRQSQRTKITFLLVAVSIFDKTYERRRDQSS